ncbi:pyridoxal phosphate-dependent aminotransferase [Tsuneonella amylolytica]|uniref:pyridoxal phosphate-dependent aminotransferase n=1 Tax=Tsuneonella amylolytica TaxID=2338327 RepID=UPI000EA971C5|nr:histidinol-phosphate transaminase [Tsuneonella amylolytica]
MADRPTLKPWIECIHAYVPGKSAGADGTPLVKLSANENPLGCSPAVFDARAQAAAPGLYPDPDSTDLREALGARFGIDPARIVCGTGSGELLHCAVQAFAGPGDTVVMPRYSFSLYPLLAAKVGAEAVPAPDADYAASADSLLASVDDRTRVVLLDNPNNPVGCWLDAGEVARLHAGLPTDVLLVVDQAYAEYLGEGQDDGGLALAAAHDNVLVTRTFSKAYGIAGERVGWATGAPHLIDAINRLRGAFNVTATGQAAALAALGDEAFVERSRAENAANRERLAGALAPLGNHGIRALPSEGNFVLVLFDGALNAAAAMEAIAAAGYAVRHLPGQGLGNALRITVGKAIDMEAVAEAIRRAVEKAG